MNTDQSRPRAESKSRLNLSETRPSSEVDPSRGSSVKTGYVILLVEDNPADIKITQRAFKDSGIHVDLIVARDGQEAIDYLLHQGAYADKENLRTPDLILLDLNLPLMNGREVLERVRNNPKLKTVPVVVLTTSRRLEDVEQMYAAGANTYIEKPQEFKRFVKVLQTIYSYWVEVAILPPVPH